MNIKAEQKFAKLIGAWVLFTLASLPFNVTASVIGVEADGSKIEGRVTETTSDALGAELNINAFAIAGTSVTEAYEVEAEPLETAPNMTSVVPLPAAAWIFLSALLGLVSVARRRQKN